MTSKMLVPAALILTLAAAPTWAVPVKPRLVVVLVVDQLRMEDLEQYGPLLGSGGMAGLGARAVTLEGRYETANTETAPGHATLSTGAYTSEHGIVSNVWAAPGGPAAMVMDVAFPTWGRTAEKDGRSPWALRVPTVGDQLKVQSGGRSHVVSVSGKDRSALFTGGFSSDISLWWDADQAAFVSSTYFAPEPPNWVNALKESHSPETLAPWTWELSFPAERYAPYTRPDVSPGEGARFGMSNTFPKVLDPLAIPAGKLGHALRFTPRMDALILEAALAAVTALERGQDGDVDLLWVGLSGFDTVGHLYGPYSMERADALIKLSQNLTTFLAALGKRVGPRQLSVVLTADHGVAPIPEDTLALRIPAGRLNTAAVVAAVDGSLDKAVAPRDWVRWVSPPNVWLDSPVQAPLTCDAMDKAAHALAEIPGVARATAACKLENLTGENWTFLQRAYDGQRGGQILMEPRPFWVWSEASEYGTDHGSSWVYDQRVPILLVAAQLKPRHSTLDSPVDMRRLAPTVALMLGCSPPPAARLPPLLQP